MLSIAVAWQSVLHIRLSWGVFSCVAVDALHLDETKKWMCEERGSDYNEKRIIGPPSLYEQQCTTEIIIFMSNRDTRNQRCRSKELLIFPTE
jgi:hypothetical protein